MSNAAWQIGTEPVLASVLCGNLLVIVEALRPDQLRHTSLVQWHVPRLVPSADLSRIRDVVDETPLPAELGLRYGDAWVRVPASVSARVRAIDVQTGKDTTLFEFECDPALLHLAWYAGQLVLTIDQGLVVCDVRTRARKTVPYAGLEPLAPPLPFRGHLYCLWRDSDRYRVTRWGNGSSVSGPGFDDRRLSYVRAWTQGPHGPIVRLEATMTGAAESSSVARLELVDPATLALTERVTESGGHVSCTQQHLFVDEVKRSQHAPSYRAPHIRIVNDHAGFVLSCLDGAARQTIKQWVIGSSVTSMVAVPRFSGILLTLADPEVNGIVRDQNYSVLTPSSPGVRVIASSSGTILGSPMPTPDGVAALVHEGGNRKLYGSWLRGGCMPAGKQARVIWNDSLGRPAGDNDPSHHYYRLEELDFTRRELHIMQFWAASPARAAIVAGERLLVILGREVRSYGLADVRANSTPFDATGATALVARSGEDLFGSPFTGPRDELWGINSKVPALDAFVASLPEQRRARASGDEDSRLEFLREELQRVEREMLRRRGDIRRLAAALPPELSGELNLTECEHFIAWERAALASRGDDAHASARMIFQDYIRQRTLGLDANSEILADVQRNRRGPFARALAWCSFGELGTPEADFSRSANRGARIRSISWWSFIAGLLLVLAGVVGEVRLVLLTPGLAICALAGVLRIADRLSDVGPAFMKRAVGRSTMVKITDDKNAFIRISEQWPNGPPACVIEPDRYLEFLNAFRNSTLLSADARSPRQDAVLLAAELLRRGVTVFISHSSRQASVAIELGEALRHRGIDVMLDRWHLELGAPDHEVESWIAESMIRADAVIYLVSRPAAASGWVMREQAWEWRLLAVKRGRTLPYLIYLEEDVAATTYPRSRCIGPTEFATLGVSGLADSLTQKIVADRLTVLREAL